MCRWLAYSGNPIPLSRLIFETRYSLIDQSLSALQSDRTTNGDGFGVGWYDDLEEPGVYKDIQPAWNDDNLYDICRHVSSPLFLAHVRATTGSAVQQTNCHPFRHRNWLWMHNGLIREFPTVKRELVMAVDPDLYPSIEGSTDSETFFYLALTFGLREDPPAAMERTVGFIEQVGRGHGVENPVQMTVATGDGERLWAFRYSSERDSRSLFFSTAVDTLRVQYPNNPRLWELSEEARLVVSEPFGTLVGAWNEVPESSWGVVQPGQDEVGRFTPRPPRD